MLRNAFWHVPPRWLGLATAFGLAAGTCSADIGSHPESSPEVRVYRALESEFLQSGKGRDHLGRLGSTLCGLRRFPDVQIDTMAADGQPATVAPAAAYATGCTQLLESLPSCISTRYFSGPSESVWQNTLHDVGFAVYVRELARRASVPSTEFEAELLGLDEETLERISKVLATGRRDYGSLYFGTGDRPEVAVKRKWNRYVLAQSAAQQAKIPVLLSLTPSMSPLACLVGGRDYRVRSRPPGAAVRLISDFDWRVCNASNQDAWSSACPGWTVVATERVALGGTYRYEAKWPSGKLSRDVVEVNSQKGDVLDLP